MYDFSPEHPRESNSEYIGDLLSHLINLYGPEIKVAITKNEFGDFVFTPLVHHERKDQKQSDSGLKRNKW